MTDGGAPTRAERKLWSSLARKRVRDETGLFLAEGIHAAVDLAASELRVERVLVAEGVNPESPLREALVALGERGARVDAVPGHVIEEVSDTVTPQGVLAVVRIPEGGAGAAATGLTVALDGVQDPGNVGTIIRTGEALGASAVVCLPGTADPWSPKVVRASGGASFRIPVRSADFEAVREQIRSSAGEIWGADLDGAPVDREARLPGTLCLVLGSEAHGLRPDVRSAADRLVRISMHSSADSLNVAIAGAILLDRLLSAHRASRRTTGEEEGAA